MGFQLFTEIDSNSYFEEIFSIYGNVSLCFFFTLEQAMKAQVGSRWGECLMPHLGRFTTEK